MTTARAGSRTDGRVRVPATFRVVLFALALLGGLPLSLLVALFTGLILDGSENSAGLLAGDLDDAGALLVLLALALAGTAAVAVLGRWALPGRRRAASIAAAVVGLGPSVLAIVGAVLS